MTNEELLAALSAHFGAINNRLDNIDSRLDSIQEQLDELKEDSEITRDGVNSLLEWADIIGKLNNYPIAK